jgi:hypothetical protein
MPKIEILFYSPKNLNEFIDFCINGKPTEPGQDEIFGVISWLHGWGVQEAHFFHTPPNHAMTFFMALVHKHEDDPTVRPWFITDLSAPPRIILEPDIPGIDEVLRVDGELGMLDEPKSIGELLAAVTLDEDLEAAFVATKKRVDEVLKRLGQDPHGKERFLAALRSERGSKPAEVFKELNFSLRD